MKRKRIKRRQSHGSAWHWKQTDCWYCTPPGTKKRVALFNEQGERIRGNNPESKRAAEIALARERLTWNDDAAGAPRGPWKVARVCSDYIQYCERGLANGTISKSHRDNTVRWLNDLCSYCGALTVSKLKKGHVQEWVDSHDTWKSPVTRRGALTVVNAAFNRAEEMFGVPNPIKGLKKPNEKPRLTSISPEDEKAIYGACEPCFRNFLFAAFHTGLRPFCELAKLTADDTEEHERGMMWRVYSSKTDKTRKIPVRPEVAEVTRKLMKTAPKGSGKAIFRNTKDGAWKGMTGVVRFIAIKKKLGWDQDPVKKSYSCYTCRHTFVHRMLSGYWTNGEGASIETVAELIGDTPSTTYRHYGREWAQHYQERLWKAIGEEKKPTRKKATSAKTKSAKRKTKSRKRKTQQSA